MLPELRFVFFVARLLYALSNNVELDVPSMQTEITQLFEGGWSGTEKANSDVPRNNSIPEGLYYVQVHSWYPGDVVPTFDHFWGSSSKNVDSYARYMKQEQARLQALEFAQNQPHTTYLRRVLQHFKLMGQDDRLKGKNFGDWVRDVRTKASWWKDHVWTLTSHGIQKIADICLGPVHTIEDSNLDPELRIINRVNAMPFFLEQLGKDEFRLKCMQNQHPYFGHFVIYNPVTESLELSRETGKYSAFVVQGATGNDGFYHVHVWDQDRQDLTLLDTLFKSNQLNPSLVSSSEKMAFVPQSKTLRYSDAIASFRFVEAKDVMLQYDFFGKIYEDYAYLFEEKAYHPDVLRRSFEQELDNSELTSSFMNRLAAFPALDKKYQQLQKKVEKQVKKTDDPDNSSGRSPPNMSLAWKSYRKLRKNTKATKSVARPPSEKMNLRVGNKPFSDMGSKSISIVAV